MPSVPGDKNVRSSADLPSALAQSQPGKDISKSPKNKLQELCQSMRFSIPKYNQTSESSIVVSITIEGQEVCYRYTSEHTMSTRNYIKQCEENAAEKAFKALTELYGTCTSNIPAQQTTHEQSGKAAFVSIVYSCLVFAVRQTCSTSFNNTEYT